MTKQLSVFLTALLLMFAVPSILRSSGIFPYEYKIKTLDSGLTVVSIPLNNPDIISHYVIVRSGSRNEVEPGKSGFAHFFEHMMFKGTKTMPTEAYNDFITELGAGTNGFTTDDYTCYFVVFAGRENLEEVIKVEADRFINLYYDEEMLKTEATVIEGEYYASVSNPSLVAGDFDHEQLMGYVHKYYDDWNPSNYTLVTPEEPPQTKPKRAHYEWPTRTLPLLAIGFHGPAYSDEKIDLAALDLMAEIAFSRSSALYQRLVIEEQKCQSLSASFSDHRDPYLLVFNAVVKKEEDLPYVEEAILKELERLEQELVDEKALADIKSNLKYSFANALGTTDGIASSLLHYLNLTGDPGTVNRLFDLYDKITPQDIQKMVKTYFKTTNSTVVTLSGGKAK